MQHITLLRVLELTVVIPQTVQRLSTRLLIAELWRFLILNVAGVQKEVYLCSENINAINLAPNDELSAEAKNAISQ